MLPVVPPELCERTALAGDIAVKLAWGKVQEAAALFALLNIFPEALVEEVRQPADTWKTGLVKHHSL